MPAHLKRSDDGEALELDLADCKGSEFGDTLAKIKDVPGSKFDWDRKLWMIPAEAGPAERVLHSIQPTCDDELTEWVREARMQSSQELTTQLPDDAELQVEWAKHRAEFQPEFIQVGTEKIPFNGLLQHQRPIVDIAARVRKLIIGDDMGLGKTGSAISAVEEWCQRSKVKDDSGVSIPDGPKLVVCPNSVKSTWRRELRLWLGDDEPFQIVDGSTPAARNKQLTGAIQEDAWCIVNWEQLRVKKERVEVKRRNGAIGAKTIEVMKEPLFETTPWLAVVADEVHRAKNRKAQATRGLWRTRADDGLMLAMSGTPLMNSPDELWAILHWLWPKEYTSYWRFYEQYVDYYEGYMGGRTQKVITGVRNPDALRFELKDRLVRRTQGMVLDLPGKVRIPVSIELGKTQRKLYEKAEKEMWLEVEKAIKEGDKQAEQFAAAVAEGNSVYQIPNGAARTVRLRQILESPALLGGDDDSAVLDACVDKILDSQPSTGAREQWVVYTEFADTPDLLCARLEGKGLVAKPYTGRISTDVRAKLEEGFQRGDIDVLVGTIKSIYQGITLTASNKQFWVSRDWVPDVNEQGEDRQNRIGQNSRVFVYIAQPEDTVATSKIAPLNRLKERIVRAVIPKDHIETTTKEVA